MNKDIEELIQKRIKNILKKEILTEEDLKFLILYKKIERPSFFDNFKKIIDFINSNNESGEN